MKEQNFEQVNQPVKELLILALEYCKTVENQDISKNSIINFLSSLLPAMYFKGFLLSMRQYEYDEAFDEDEYLEKYVTEAQWFQIYEDFKVKFEKDNDFKFYHPIEQVVKDGNIAECIADIYQDLKNFILLFNKGLEGHQHVAILELAKSFKENWGWKILILLPALHYIQFGNLLITYSVD